MDAILFLLPIALMLGGVFLGLFLKATAEGQFDDLDDPPLRMLWEDDPPTAPSRTRESPPDDR